MNDPNKHNCIIKFLLLLMVTAFAVAITGCGGGGSSSGGGGGAAGVAGTFSGTGTVRVSSPSGSGMTISVPYSTVIEIDPNGNVTVDPDTPYPMNGKLSGNSFAINMPASSLNDAELSCTGSITIHGTCTPNAVNGTISSSGVVCNGVPMAVTGDYTATRVPAGSRAVSPDGLGQSITESLREAIRN